MNSRIVLVHQCLFLALATTAFAQNAPDEGSLLADLSRPETTMRAATALIKQAEAQISVRDRLSEQIPHLLMTATDCDVVDNEARVAGELKLVSAIPALIEFLDRYRYSGFTGANRAVLGTLSRSYELQDIPVGRALADIGAPSVPALAIPLESAQVDIRRKAARILILIDTPESFSLLQQHVDQETDNSLKRYIAANLKRDKELRHAN